MVNQGPSRGCLNCRQSRVKCDEKTPICGRCATRRLTCIYGKAPLKIRFKYEDPGSQQSEAGEASRPQQTITALSRRRTPPESEETLATNFFITFFATLGRSQESGNGFFESIVPTLARDNINASLKLTIEAVSAFFFGRFHKSSTAMVLSQTRLSQGFRQLRVELADLQNCPMDGILLTILLMQCHEITKAVTQGREPADIHRSGALNLVKSLGFDNFQSRQGKSLLLYILSAEVGSAMQEYRIVDPMLSEWFDKASDLPWNQYSRLNQIGVRVAYLRSKAAQLQQTDQTSSLESLATPGTLQDLRSEANGTVVRLLSWSQQLPEEWTPLRFGPSRQPSELIDLYDNICEVYPSVEIAATWNTWRLYLLVLCEVRQAIRRCRESLAETSIATDSPDVPWPDARELIDTICYSVAFHLGDRTYPESPGATTQLESMIFPTYRTLDQFGFSPGDRVIPADLMSKADHVKHALAQGPWQIAIILGQLHTLLPRLDGTTLQGNLDQNQAGWILKQLIRTSVLLGVNA